MDPSAKRPFLRKHLGFKQSWPYYFAMFVDPMIRADWFFYIVYASQLQHSALLSFMLALAEVFRRFMWCFFRIENEHIGNVGANRAYRALPLPYHLPESPTPSELGPEPIEVPHAQTAAEHDLERVDTLRRRRASAAVPESPVLIVRTMTRVGRSIGGAHRYDYERRRGRDGDEDAEASGDSDDDDEDSEEFFERTREVEAVRGRARSGTVGTMASNHRQ
jgi:hypothetical protein